MALARELTEALSFAEEVSYHSREVLTSGYCTLFLERSTARKMVMAILTMTFR